MSDREEFARRRAAIRQKFGSLYDFLLALLFDVDPVGINFETNNDEYEPEVDTILPRLGGRQTVEELQRVIHEEFVRWFGVEIAGPAERYATVARRLHAELDRRRLT